jgi:hypothetical protein
MRWCGIACRVELDMLELPALAAAMALAIDGLDGSIRRMGGVGGP